MHVPSISFVGQSRAEETDARQNKTMSEFSRLGCELIDGIFILDIYFFLIHRWILDFSFNNHVGEFFLLELIEMACRAKKKIRDNRDVSRKVIVIFDDADLAALTSRICWTIKCR